MALPINRQNTTKQSIFSNMESGSKQASIKGSRNQSIFKQKGSVTSNSIINTIFKSNVKVVKTNFNTEEYLNIVEQYIYDNDSERVEAQKYITDLILKQKQQFVLLQQLSYNKSEISPIDQVVSEANQYYEDMFRENGLIQLQELYKDKFIKDYNPYDVSDAILNLGMGFNDEHLYWLAIAYLNAPLPPNFKMIVRDNVLEYVHFPSEVSLKLHPIHQYIQEIMQQLRSKLVRPQQMSKKKSHTYVIFKLMTETRTARFLQLLQDPTVKQLSYAHGDTESLTLHIDVIKMLRPYILELKDVFKRPYKVEIKLYMLRRLASQKVALAEIPVVIKETIQERRRTIKPPVVVFNSNIYPTGLSSASNLYEHQIDKLIQLIEYVGDIKEFLIENSIHIENPLDVFKTINEDPQQQINQELRIQKQIKLQEKQNADNLVNRITNITKLPKCLKPLHLIAIMHEIGLDIAKDLHCFVVILEFVLYTTQDNNTAWSFKILDTGKYYWFNMRLKIIKKVYPHKEELMNIIELFKKCQIKEQDKYKPLQSQLEKYEQLIDWNSINYDDPNLPVEQFLQTQLNKDAKSFINNYFDLRPRDMFNLLVNNQSYTIEWSPKKVQQYIKSHIHYSLREWLDLLFYWPYDFMRLYKKVQKEDLVKSVYPSTNKLLTQNTHFFESAQQIRPEDFDDFFQRHYYDVKLNDDIVIEDGVDVSTLEEYMQQKQLKENNQNNRQDSQSVVDSDGSSLGSFNQNTRKSRGSVQLKDFTAKMQIKRKQTIYLPNTEQKNNLIGEELMQDKLLEMKKFKVLNTVTAQVPENGGQLFNVEEMINIRNLKKIAKAKEDKGKRRNQGSISKGSMQVTNVNSNSKNMSVSGKHQSKQSISGDNMKKIKQKLENLQKNMLPALCEINENEEPAERQGHIAKISKSQQVMIRAIKEKMSKINEKHKSPLKGVDYLIDEDVPSVVILGDREKEVQRLKDDLKRQQMKIMMSKIPKSILESKIVNLPEIIENKRLQTVPIDSEELFSPDVRCKTTRAWPMEKEIQSHRVYFKKYPEQPLPTQYPRMHSPRNHSPIVPPVQVPNIVPLRDNVLLMDQYAFSNITKKIRRGEKQHKKDNDELFKPEGLNDYFFQQRTKESIKQVKAKNPEIMCFNLNEKDFYEDIYLLRDKISKICIDLITFDFLCQQIMNPRERNIITKSYTLKQKVYFIFRRVFDKSRDVIMGILKEDSDLRENFITLFGQYESGEQTQAEIQSVSQQKSMYKLHKELSERLFKQYPLIKDIMTQFKSSGFSLLDNLIVLQYKQFIKQVEVQEDDPLEIYKVMMEKLATEGGSFPFDADVNATASNLLLDIIYQDNIKLTSLDEDDKYKFSVNVEDLKKKVINDTKLQLNCLTYQQFAYSLGQCNQLLKSDFHFNLLTCELGPILMINRNVIYNYELFIDQSLELDHVNSMITYLGIQKDEIDLIWIAYLFCLILIKFTLPEEKTLSKILISKIDIPHKVFFLILIDHNRIRRSFFIKNFNRFEEYVQLTSWFQFMNEKEEFYYYNFKTKMKKPDLQTIQFYQIEKFVILERQELLRLVLGMNFLVYGKELQINSMPGEFSDSDYGDK